MIDLQASDIRTFLPSQDLELSKVFYVALGFSVQYSDANLALLSTGTLRFYLQRYYVKDWAANSMLHITVADAASCCERLRGHAHRSAGRAFADLCGAQRLI